MGLFRELKSLYKKRQAAVVVQNLLAHQANAGILEQHPATLATQLVAAAWNAMPDVFDGKFGQRPHKFTVAAAALAHGLEHCLGDDLEAPVALSLGNLLAEVETNEAFYPFNSLDARLLRDAFEFYRDYLEQTCFERPTENASTMTARPEQLGA